MAQKKANSQNVDQFFLILYSSLFVLVSLGEIATFSLPTIMYIPTGKKILQSFEQLFFLSDIDGMLGPT